MMGLKRAYEFEMILKAEMRERERERERTY
jgi:hypothetical protein